MAVAIIGAGQSKFGTRKDVNVAELAWEAVKPAMQSANVEQKDIDFMVVGTAGMWSSEAAVPALMYEYGKFEDVGSMRVEAACATGNAAIRVGYTAIESGEADVVLVLGVEKMQESPNPTVIELIGRFGSYFWEFENFGLTFPGYYALHATAYMAKYGATEEDFARVAVKNHHYGAKNPYAQFQREISLEKALNSPYVAWPFKLFDCSPITDGSAAVILASEEKVKEWGIEEKIWILGQGVGTGTANLSRRESFTSLRSAAYAAEVAYKKAGIDMDAPYKYLDGADVHDCFTAAEVIAYEDLRFAKRGEGVQLVREEQTYIGGRIPVNVDGGLKAKGHPIGATGVSQAVEAWKQLLSKAENGRQVDVKNGRYLAHNVGGTGHYSYVTIYGLEKR
ncbi:Acetyl-CoA acetyltransferase [Geoglobus ahangari]|uniref:Acetyl-CoA acetyltransferase n=1 Tax=Geoglobus ahangari TaxID=113653 RepID=A0A0F7DC38_9EURY|nr:thiolase domain-containing protein [Geoglobus ahangari]AKG92166.1 Acetyl-CoA acetyltransferase [Geoglobus ahangari]NOY11314.1 thiolase domain-containing protein [Archaeoglobi archaeon]